MASIKLSSGYDMPQVGFGLWKVGNDVCANVVYEAIKAGYRLFDGACDYGNEKECGEGVARAISEGLVKREDLFIVSKLWNTFHNGERVEPIVRKQLADWGVDYFDLYLIHFPVALEWVDPEVRYPPGWHYDGKDEVRLSKASIQETWTAMEGLVEKKLARSIGVSNFHAQLVYDLMRTAKIPPATLQIEHHPYLVQQSTVTAAKALGIAVTAYSSFGTASFAEFNMPHIEGKIKSLLEDDTINALAKKYNTQPSSILLRWASQRGLAVIPKTTRVNVMKENLEHVNINLEQADIDAISAMDRGLRFNAPNNYNGIDSDLLWIF